MNGARDDQFDVDPEEWRKQFWGNDASAKTATESKGNGADSGGWGEPDMGVLRLRRPARSTMSSRRCSRASRR